MTTDKDLIKKYKEVIKEIQDYFEHQEEIEKQYDVTLEVRVRVKATNQSRWAVFLDDFSDTDFKNLIYQAVIDSINNDYDLPEEMDLIVNKITPVS